MSRELKVREEPGGDSLQGAPGSEAACAKVLRQDHPCLVSLSEELRVAGVE